jgi:hypothetical protein
MGCAAKVIVLDDVRASQQRQALRQQLHAHFDRWLDEIEAEFPESEPTLARSASRSGGYARNSPLAWPRRLSRTLTRKNSVESPCGV